MTGKFVAYGIKRHLMRQTNNRRDFDEDLDPTSGMGAFQASVQDWKRNHLQDKAAMANIQMAQKSWAERHPIIVNAIGGAVGGIMVVLISKLLGL